MNTECNLKQYEFHALGSRQVRGKFDGGAISSDGGAVLLRELELQIPILSRLANCFTDHRNPDKIEHGLLALLKQRVYGITLGYEDINDHDHLRFDPLLAVVCEKTDPCGEKRLQAQDKGKPLAGKSTLNRLELGDIDEAANHRYKKITGDPTLMDDLMVDLFVESFKAPPKQIILDVDATDDRLHGSQEDRFYHGYYKHYCYLPLYIFCGDQLLCARLRPANQDGAAGTVEEMQRIVSRIRSRWPKVQIILRGDSGFCRDSIMVWCEQNKVDYVLGLAKNKRLKATIADELEQAKTQHQKTGKAARVFKDFRYQTLKSWSCKRRVVGKAEHLAKGSNPRFVVTTLSKKVVDARRLYEDIYCARGDMENRIKEQQLDLFADRTSTHGMCSNQLRLYFSSWAYIVLETLRRVGLVGTEIAKAQCGTIRLKLLKIGAQIRVSVRKVWISWSENYPHAGLFEQILSRLRKLPMNC